MKSIKKHEDLLQRRKDMLRIQANAEVKSIQKLEDEVRDLTTIAGKLKQKERSAGDSIHKAIRSLENAAYNVYQAINKLIYRIARNAYKAAEKLAGNYEKRFNACIQKQRKLIDYLDDLEQE